MSASDRRSLDAGRIPALDGLRAAALGIVLISHLYGAGVRLPMWLGLTLGDADIGIYLFFVISGFLITGLLLEERARQGAIRVGRFYRRRAYRIFPAFYALIATLLVLAWRGWVAIRPAEFAAAAFYVWNYFPGSTPLLGHIWTLCVEEQFYLLWPLVLRRRCAVRFTLAVLALSPLLRVAVYLALPAWRARIPIMLPTRADALLWGAALALLGSRPRMQAWLQTAFRRGLPGGALLFLLVVSPRLNLRWHGAYLLTVGWTAQGMAIVAMLAWLLRYPRSRAARLLAAPPVVHLGRISYSLYLWQQLFIAPSAVRAHLGVALGLPAAWLAAEVSYRCIERPFLRWRDRGERRGGAPVAAMAEAVGKDG